MTVSFLIFNTVSLPQGDGLIIGNNYRIFPGNTSQSEVFITKHPTDPDILFSSANTISFTPTFFVSEGVYVSTDAGNSWYGSDTCNGANIYLHYGDPAIAIDKNGTFILARKGTDIFTGAFSHYSTDSGLNWSAQKTITSDELERTSIISDNDPTSTFYGRTYAVWALLTPPYPIKFTFTDDITTSWNTVSQINNPTVRGAGGEISLGPNGEVYICWAGLTSFTPFKEIQVGFASSSNGGANWNLNENAFPMNGILGVLTNKQNIRVNGLPRMAVDLSNTPTRGTIYIVTSQINLLPAGTDPDIILRKSVDGGLTWSSGIRVNQDALNNGKYQFFPGITVDEFGGVNIIFYDDRNTTSDSSGVFLARSIDAGNSWLEYEISDHNFKPAAIGGLGQGYMGDNIDITSVGNKLFPVWMDNSTGLYQIWSVPIEINPVNEEQPPFIVEPVNIADIKPNSFTINFRTLRNGNSKIKFGLTEALELDSIIINSDTTIHSITVSNLEDSTLYYFQAHSLNAYGNSYSQIQSVRTSAKPDTTDAFPTEYYLKQNYPNPFNSNTIIEFNLPQSSNVSLKIFDLIGNEVASLLNEFIDAGPKKVNFEVVKYNLASGVYFYRLTADGFTQTKPMILLK